MTRSPSDPPLKKLSEFRDLLPGARSNSHPHPTTLVRHVTRGVRLPDGTRLRLRAVRVGSTWLTTDEWFADFVAALTAAHAPAPPTEPRSPGDRARASRAADARLKELGL